MTKLKKLVPGGYQKNQIDMYKILDGTGNEKGKKQKTALGNAMKLQKIHSQSDKLTNNPSTTVYKLVNALNDLTDKC